MDLETYPCRIIHFINMQNLNDIHPKSMNTENPVFRRNPRCYKQGGIPPSVNVRGPHVAQDVYSTVIWDGMDGGDRAAAGRRSESHRLKWRSLGA